MVTDLIHLCKLDHAKPYSKILKWFPEVFKIQPYFLAGHTKLHGWLLFAFHSIISYPPSSCIGLDTLSSIFFLSFRTLLKGHNLSWKPNLRYAPPLVFCKQPAYASLMHHSKVRFPEAMRSWKVNIMNILTAAPGTEPETQQELRKRVSPLERGCSNTESPLTLVISRTENKPVTRQKVTENVCCENKEIWKGPNAHQKSLI